MIPKFRAWDKKNNRMLFRGFFDLNWYSTPRNENGRSNWECGAEPEDKNRVELMLSTGLKDRNGIEIFEGDFLKWAGEGNLVESNIRRVEWTDRFSITPLDFAPFGECWEVIGNVYDNKELLEAKK